MRSDVPIHHRAFSREWVKADQVAIERGLEYRRRMKYQYDKRSRKLPRLRIGQEVIMQNPETNVWDTPGTIVAIGATGRDYRIKNDAGKLAWKNRRFLRRLYKPVDYGESANAGGARESQTDITSTNDPNPSQVTAPRENAAANVSSANADIIPRRSRRAPKPIARLDL